MIPRIHFKNAAMYVKMGDRNEVRNQLNMASDILHQIPEIDISQVEGQREIIEDSSPIESFARGTKSVNPEEIWERTLDFYEQEIYGRAFLGAMGMLTYDPLDKDARLMMANIYERQSNWHMALVEYQNLLKYHEDQEILNKINELRDKMQYGI